MQTNTASKLVRVMGPSAALAALAVIAALAVSVGSARASFGIASFDQQITADAAGDPFTQAGGHPYAITTEIQFNTYEENEENEFHGALRPEADVKDVVTELPPGMVGNPVGLAQCTEAQLSSSGPLDENAECPLSSQVGVISLRTDIDALLGVAGLTVPLYNMVPPSNEPASFGFLVGGVPITLFGNVRNGGDFGINISSLNIPTALPLDGLTLTFWGNPSDPSHDAQRCEATLFGFPANEICPGTPGTRQGPNSDPEPTGAFVTLPVSCTAAGEGFKTNLRIDSWPNPGIPAEKTLFNHRAPGYPLAPAGWGSQQNLTGCDVVPFNPSITVAPTNTQADTPTGLNIDIKLPQDGLINSAGIATADVKKTVVALPSGVSISPSAATGLGACSLAQIGLDSGNPPACPDSSKLGTVEILTPLLPVPLKGAIYLGKQGENPFGSLVAVYIVAEAHGVILKLPGHVDLDATTGQVTTTFDNTPQLPFSELKVNFKGGPRSPLVNPHNCGTYSTSAQITPWSGTAPVNVGSAFQITSGPNGSPCPAAPQAFAPSFAMGTTNNQAGAFTPLTLTLGRSDGEQQLGGITVKTPSGLLGMLSSVALCPEPQAAQGTCGAASEIGSVIVGAGAGANPFYVHGGRVYLTGGYKGAPFGLSIVVPAVAGPFDLGTVVVRAQIIVDRHTAELTIAADPLPTILQGIPLDLRTVNVSIARPGFIFNPTNCDPQKVTGTLTGDAGGSEAVSSGFQVTNCGTLGFKPKFTVSTSGHTSRANGASLDAKIVYPKGAQANIAKVKVDLPKQLPSRLTTLQKACTAAVFDANPSSCPAGSVVGSASAVTPVLPVKLSGPVYFVSNGGEAFPNLVVVLQGYGVTVNLVSDTFISKAGITSSTFKTVPDVPISSFELLLPQGPHSALAANGNLCKSKLAMPTAFVAQDGAEIHQSTPVKATGCPKAKAKKHTPKRRSKTGGRK